MHGAPIDPAATSDNAVRRHVLVHHAEQSGTVFGKEPHFLKASVVDQFVNAFPGSEFTRRMLLVDTLFSAAELNLGALLTQAGNSFLQNVLRCLGDFRCHMLSLNSLDSCPSGKTDSVHHDELHVISAVYIEFLPGNVVS